MYVNEVKEGNEIYRQSRQFFYIRWATQIIVRSEQGPQSVATHEFQLINKQSLDVGLPCPHECVIISIYGRARSRFNMI